MTLSSTVCLSSLPGECTWCQLFVSTDMQPKTDQMEQRQKQASWKNRNRNKWGQRERWRQKIIWPSGYTKFGQILKRREQLQQQQKRSLHSFMFQLRLCGQDLWELHQLVCRRTIDPPPLLMPPLSPIPHPLFQLNSSPVCSWQNNLHHRLLA